MSHISLTPTQYRIAAVPEWAPGANRYEVYIHYDRNHTGWFIRAHDGLYLDSEGGFTTEPIPMERQEAEEVARDIVAARVQFADHETTKDWWTVTVTWDDDEIEDAVLATSRKDALTSARANWTNARTITVH